MVRFDVARFLLDESDAPPGDDADWESVKLTDLWRERRPQAEGRGWYRMSFALEEPPRERWAVYLPGLASNAAVFVNGEFIGDGGRMRKPVALNSNRPLFFPISPRLLSPGENRIDVALFAYRDSYDRLEPLFAGPELVLAPRFERQHFWHIDVSRFATALVIALLLFMGAIWLGASREPVYGWFLATGGFWAVASFNYHIQDLPISFHAWERLVHGCLSATAISSVFLTHRMLGIAARSLEHGLAAYAVLVAAVVVFTPVGSFLAPLKIIHLADVVLIAYCASTIARRRAALVRTEIAVFLTGLLGFFVIALHDAVIQFGALPMERPRLLPLGGPLILLTFASYLTARFVRATTRMNTELATRLRDREAELELRHAAVAQLERDRALAGERTRILREVHDGVGGKIVSGLALLETGRAEPARIAETLRESLEDMRLLMRSFHPGAGELEGLLAALRERLEARLEGAGVALEWRPGDLPDGLALSPEQAHHVSRILEESFTNVIKHAGASHVVVATEWIAGPEVDEGVLITVRDDGCGGIESTTGGYGLRHMRERARTAGGDLSIQSSAAGTELRLWLPLRAPGVSLHG